MNFLTVRQQHRDHYCHQPKPLTEIPCGLIRLLYKITSLIGKLTILCCNYFEYDWLGSCWHCTCSYVIQVEFQTIHAMTKVTPIIGRNQQISHQFSMLLRCFHRNKAIDHKSLGFIDRNIITLWTTCCRDELKPEINSVWKPKDFGRFLPKNFQWLNGTFFIKKMYGIFSEFDRLTHFQKMICT